MKEKDASIENILIKAESIFKTLSPIYSFDVFSENNITISQMRILLLLKTKGPLRVGAIAGELQVSTPTITGIVDNLVKKEYVIRHFSEDDRRLVLCELSENGMNVMNRIWTMSRKQIKEMINGLSQEKIKEIEKAAEILLENVLKKKGQAGR